jgi:hypothetical protein
MFPTVVLPQPETPMRMMIIESDDNTENPKIW